MKKNAVVIGIFIFGLLSSILSAQTNWVLQKNPFGYGDSAMVGKIQFVSSTEGWISGRGATLLHTINGGDTWSVVTPFAADTAWSFSDPGLNLCFISPSIGWIMKTPGSTFENSHGAIVYKTTDGGSHWEKTIVTQGAGEVGVQLQFVDANTGWITVYQLASGTGRLLKTTDGGKTWTQIQTLPRTDEVILFTFADTKNGWMTTINDNPPLFQIAKTSDGGSTWTNQYTDTAPNGDTTTSSGAMQFTDADHGWVSGPNGRILKTINGGATWQLLKNAGTSTYTNSKSLFFLDANTGWIASSTHLPNQPSTHTILRTTDGGATWSQEPLPAWATQSSIFSMYFSGNTLGWLVGDYGVIGKFSGVTAVKAEPKIPNEIALFPNFPNPFNPSTIVRYSIPEAQHVRLSIFDVQGNEVAVLVNRQQPAGMHEAIFNAASQPSGIYFCRLEVNSTRRVSKVLLLR
ncbi:MAG: YCF48-related protein [Acidobacteriota bacterium]